MEHKTTNKYLALALFWTAVVTVGCLASMNDVAKVDIQVENVDKVVHFTFYAFFAIFWFLYLQNIVSNTKLFLTVFAFSVSFGIVIEICQSLFTVSRQGDILDVIANTLGALFGLTLIKFYKYIFKK